MYRSVFIHSPTEALLGYLQVLAIMNLAALSFFLLSPSSASFIICFSPLFPPFFLLCFPPLSPVFLALSSPSIDEAIEWGMGCGAQGQDFSAGLLATVGWITPCPGLPCVL